MNMSVALGYAVTVVNGSEGFSACAYLDTLARPAVWTIGHGTTRIDGKPVDGSMTCTRHQADLWAMADMMEAAHYVLHYVTVDLNEWQAGALISFCYNVGAGTFRGSSVVRELNAKQYAAAADRLLDYDHANGRVIPGLLARRVRERALFQIGLGTYRAEAPLSATDKLNQAELEQLHAPLSEADELNQAQLDHLGA